MVLPNKSKTSTKPLSKPLLSSGTKVLGIKSSLGENAGVIKAEVVVATGRGIGKQEEELSRLRKSASSILRVKTSG
jgi:electron transfer flavoprotein alpha subunit